MWYQNTLCFFSQHCQYKDYVISTVGQLWWIGEVFEGNNHGLRGFSCICWVRHSKTRKSSVRKPVSWLTLNLGTSQTQAQSVSVTPTCSFKEYVQVGKTRGTKLDQAHQITQKFSPMLCSQQENNITVCIMTISTTVRSRIWKCFCSQSISAWKAWQSDSNFVSAWFNVW
jgi:hypothetical protein